MQEDTKKAGGGSTEPAPFVVEQIIARALADREFCDQLFSDRASALTGYDLTEADREAIDLLELKPMAGTQPEVSQWL
jgi:hypothetical protein